MTLEEVEARIAALRHEAEGYLTEHIALATQADDLELLRCALRARHIIEHAREYLQPFRWRVAHFSSKFSGPALTAADHYAPDYDKHQDRLAKAMCVGHHGSVEVDGISIAVNDDLTDIRFLSDAQMIEFVAATGIEVDWSLLEEEIQQKEATLARAQSDLHALQALRERLSR